MICTTNISANSPHLPAVVLFLHLGIRQNFMGRRNLVELGIRPVLVSLLSARIVPANLFRGFGFRV